MLTYIRILLKLGFDLGKSSLNLSIKVSTLKIEFQLEKDLKLSRVFQPELGMRGIEIVSKVRQLL